jgi:hypothetical protein
MTLMFLAGLASYAAYNPNLARVNDTTPNKGLLGSWLPTWPTNPSWLTTGAYVLVGGHYSQVTRRRMALSVTESGDQ